MFKWFTIIIITVNFKFFFVRIDHFIIIFPASILIFLVSSYQIGTTSFAFDNFNFAILVPLEHGISRVLRHDSELQVIRSWTSSQGNASLRFAFQVSKEVAIFGSGKSIILIAVVPPQDHSISVSVSRCNEYTWATIKSAVLVQRKAWN